MAAMATTTVEAYASTYVFMHKEAQGQGVYAQGWRKNLILVCFFFGLLIPGASIAGRQILLVLCQRARLTNPTIHHIEYNVLAAENIFKYSRI